ncbi:transketolase family protein [Candidatus Kaiserbacteria bacterium]|nr:transketolase family protein [Candidatus Kaiserbacteria bacterium]
MLNPDAHLALNIFSAGGGSAFGGDNPDKAATREGFGKGVVEAGKIDERVVVLTADLIESTNVGAFQKEFPDRFIEMGVAEQNLATVASGMAAYGKIPFFTSFATFNPGRNWEQIRTTIAINNVHAICCGMHAGLLTGQDGATHQALEDIAMMRALPNMIVISACDAEEARKATLAAAKVGKPVYMRFAREKMPTMTTAETPFEIGKANVLWKAKVESGKSKVAVFATGPVLHNVLLAAKQLEEEGVATSVTNVHTIKPLDEETILREAAIADTVVTVEEHQVHGGLGGAIAELLSQKAPTPLTIIGVQDRFGQSGEARELYEEYGLGVSHIVATIKKAMSRGTK